MKQTLSDADKTILLREARDSITNAVSGLSNPSLDLTQYSELVAAPGASFVTLTIKSNGQLRGCIGTLEAYQPLIEDVREHAIAAALDDYRFNPVRISEIAGLMIEISRLTKPEKVLYDTPEALRDKIRPGIDGVVIRDGMRRATFLPQVWDQIPDFDVFMTQLCYKMGAAGNTWKHKLLTVEIYQVEEFHE